MPYFSEYGKIFRLCSLLNPFVPLHFQACSHAQNVLNVADDADNSQRHQHGEASISNLLIIYHFQESFVNPPVVLHNQDSSHRHLMEGANDGLFLPVALNSSLKDRVAVLRILERDTLYGTLDLLHVGCFSWKI